MSLTGALVETEVKLTRAAARTTYIYRSVYIIREQGVIVGIEPASELKPQWFQILLALADHHLHGYAIMKEVLDRTDGRMRLWPGMLYGSLRRMTEAGLIEETEPPEMSAADRMERRFYRITRLGKRRLAAEASRMAEYVAVARHKRVLGKGKPA